MLPLHSQFTAAVKFSLSRNYLSFKRKCFWETAENSSSFKNFVYVTYNFIKI